MYTQEKDLNSIMFPVEQITDIQGEFGFSVAENIKSAIYRPDNNKILSMTGGNYRLSKNEDMFLPLYDGLCDRYGKSSINIKVLSYDDRRFHVDFNVVPEDKLFSVREQDSVGLRVSMSNSYDGSTKRNITAGISRLICTNGLTTLDEFVNISMKHSWDWDSRTLEDVLDSLDNMSFSKTLEMYRKLMLRSIPKHLFGEMDELVKENAGFPERLFKSAYKRMQTEVGYYRADPNRWLYYNGLNYALFNEDHSLDINKRYEIDRRVLTTLCYN